MSNIYDVSCITYTQDGKILQLSYANKAIEAGDSIISVQCKDGIINLVEKLYTNKLLTKDSNRRIFFIEKNIALAMTGRIPDCKNIMRRARSEAENYKNNYGVKIPVELLAERVSSYVHAHTMYSGYRALGASIIISGIDDYDTTKNHWTKSSGIYMITPSGEINKYFSCSNGKNNLFIKGELEKSKFNTLSIAEALPLLSKILLKSHEDMDESNFELEITTINCDNNGFSFVKRENINAIIEASKRIMDN